MPDVVTRICRERGMCLRKYISVLLILLCGVVASCAVNPVRGKEYILRAS
jgi:hypothetical protein